MSRRRLGLALGALLLVGAGIVVGTRVTARRYLFPCREVAHRPVPEGFAVRDLRADDGALVHTLEIAAPTGGRTVVYFHNNRETVEACAPLARELRAHGLGVVLVEYRGYGTSSGEPSEDALYGDAEVALASLAARGVGPSRVILWGTSLGTGVAAEMARRSRGAALVLVTPYTSIPDLVSHTAPVVPARALLADHFDTRAKAAFIRVPTLVVHGDADEIIPFAMGQEVSAAITGARFLRVPGAHHADALWRTPAALFAALADLAAAADK
jgi:pimeloyl-ACP methyl ester carboxylesterase